MTTIVRKRKSNNYKRRTDNQEENFVTAMTNRITKIRSPAKANKKRHNKSMSAVGGRTKEHC